MRFPNPVAVTCLSCGRPTVMAETALGTVQVHCGTWRWQCDTPGTVSIHRTELDAAHDQEWAA
ncbi:MAG TPA: hypothetical protein VJT72_13930 [Pseudonocardiaceae bacterium]|nr:hypothetical protein [Pseudonocardiaceae bacterium]